MDSDCLTKNFDKNNLDQAAGLKKAYVQHFHCISCDRPLDVAVCQE